MATINNMTLELNAEVTMGGLDVMKAIGLTETDLLSSTFFI